MKDLEKIWQKLNALEKAIGHLIEKDGLEKEVNTLKKEVILNKKWQPWIILLVLVFMGFITWFTTAYDSVVSMAGIGLITLGGCLMIYFFQKNTIPSQIFETNNSPENLQPLLRKKLKKRMHYWALGMGIYVLCLTFGLHLLIFGLGSLAGKGGMLGLFYGGMFGLTGYSVGMIYQIHAIRYSAILKDKNTLLPNWKIQ